MNFKEIATSWINSFTADESIKEIAQLRLKICDICPSKKEILKKQKWTHICGECGCPLSKKIFSLKFNACPLSKWADVDNNFFNSKEKKTLI